MSWVSLADAVAVVVTVAVVVATVAVFTPKKDDPCCPHCAAKGYGACYELEGVSAFGDVVEKCRYCDSRSVFTLRGSRVEMLKFTAAEWKVMRGKVPTKGFRAAHKVAQRAREARGSVGGRASTARQRVEHLRERGCDTEDD